MKNRLILVKHSLPKIEENLAAREWHLSEEGSLRAVRLAEQLTCHHPDVLVTSGEPKALETARIIETRLQLPLQVVDDLHEHERTMVSYLPSERFEMSVREFFAKPDLLIFGSETANKAHERFSNSVHTILDENKNKTSVIISHGTVISLFVSRLVGIPDFSLWKELGLPGFIVLDMQSNELIERVNIQ